MKIKDTHRTIKKKVDHNTASGVKKYFFKLPIGCRLFVYSMIVFVSFSAIYLSAYDNEKIKNDVFGILVFAKNFVSYVKIIPEKIYRRADLASLEKMYIDISPKNYQKITKQREDAMREGGILSSKYKEKVKAVISYKNDTMKDVKIRLKGDTTTDHLIGQKWSMRVELDDKDDRIGLMSKFSLQHPQRRSYVMDYILGKILSEEGNISINYDLVPVYINGSYKGIYNVEEVPGVDMINRITGKDGIVVEFDENEIFAEGEGRNKIQDYWRMVLVPKDRKYVLETTQLKNDFLRASDLINGFRNNDLKASDVFDKDKFGIWLAMQDITGATHGLPIANLKFFYDSDSDRLSPIAWDSHNEGMIESEMFNGYFRLNSLYLDRLPGFFGRLFDDPEMVKSYLSALHKVTDKKYLDKVIPLFSDDLDRYMKTLRTNYPQLTLDYQLDLIRDNQDYIRRVYLHTDQMFTAFLDGFDNDGISIKIRYIKPMPIRIISLLDEDTGMEYSPENSPFLIEPVLPTLTNLNEKVKMEEGKNIIRLKFLNKDGYDLSSSDIAKLTINYMVVGGQEEKKVEVYPWRLYDKEKILY